MADFTTIHAEVANFSAKPASLTLQVSNRIVHVHTELIILPETVIKTLSVKLFAHTIHRKTLTE